MLIRYTRAERRSPGLANTPVRTWRCDDERWERLRERAAEEGRDVSAILREAADLYLAQPLDHANR